MGQIVYADILFITNFIVDYYLIKTAAYLSSNRPSAKRVFAGALVGAASSFLILLPPMPPLLSVTVKLLSALVVAAAAFGLKKPRALFAGACWFVIASMMFAGLLAAIDSAFSPDALAVNNLYFYIDLSPLFLIFSIIAAYLAISLMRFFLKKPNAVSETTKILLELEDNKYELSAFTDTGNKLCDCFSGSPVVVVDRSRLGEMIRDDRARLLETECADVPEQLGAVKGMRPVPYRSLGGAGIIWGVTAKGVKRASDGKSCNSVVVAFSDVSELHAGADAIIGEDIFV